MADDAASRPGGYRFTITTSDDVPAGWFVSAAVNANNVVAFAAGERHYKSASVTAGGASASAAGGPYASRGPRFVAGTGAQGSSGSSS
jgi:hypothetical protein